MGTLFETSFGLLLALIIAFVHSWILTIVILGFVPIMMAAGLLQVKALTGHAVGYKKALENAGKVSNGMCEYILSCTYRLYYYYY